jgi:hypothetical protein
MKHLQAGIIIGAIVGLAIVTVLLIVRVLATVFDGPIAVAIVGLVAIVIIGASVLDWWTEGKR